MNNEKSSSIKRSLLEYLRVIVVTLLFSYTLLFFFQVARVHGTSMLPNYDHGDILIVDKFLYKNGEPDYNDIVIVDYGSNDELYIIKRIVGLPGDCLEIINNELFINGELLVESYLYSEMLNEDMKVDIPSGKIFIMGDNRNVSLDSRSFGYVDFDSEVIGRVMFSFK